MGLFGSAGFLKQKLERVEFGSEEKGVFQTFIANRLPALEQGKESFGSEGPLLLVGKADDRLHLLLSQSWENIDGLTAVQDNRPHLSGRGR